MIQLRSAVRTTALLCFFATSLESGSGWAQPSQQNCNTQNVTRQVRQILRGNNDQNQAVTNTMLPLAGGGISSGTDSAANAAQAAGQAQLERVKAARNCIKRVRCSDRPGRARNLCRNQLSQANQLAREGETQANVAINGASEYRQTFVTTVNAAHSVFSRIPYLGPALEFSDALSNFQGDLRSPGERGADIFGINAVGPNLDVANQETDQQAYIDEVERQNRVQKLINGEL